jgi:hypothetical protein
MARDRMRNHLSGDVRENSTVVQVGNARNITINNRDANSGRPSKPGSVSPRDPKAASGGGALVLIVLIGFILHSCDSNAGNVRNTTFPGEHGTRPANVSDDAIKTLVADKMKSCASEVVLTPANCPQSHSAQAAQKVRWELVGDPSDGAQVVWHDDRFFARGTATMSLTYDSVNGPEGAIKLFHFQTEVPWRGSESRVENIYQPRTPPAAGTIKKQRFELPENAVTAAVRDGFASCVNSPSSPLPATCPRLGSAPQLTNAAWRLEADPLTNWSIEGEAEFGLIRLVASYKLALRSRNAPNAPVPMYTQDGAYEATVVRTADGSARLLTIKHR